MIRTIFILISIVGLLTVGCSTAPDTSTPKYDSTRLTESIYVIFGPNQLPSPVNKGFMNNPGFVITTDGVVLIDPGSSSATGDSVANEIKKQTDKPVVAIINSHVHGDHWLGNGGVLKHFPDAVIYAHQEMINRSKAGAGEDWIKLMNDLTNGAIAGTKPVIPNHALKDGEVITVGSTRFRIHHTGQAHTDGDLMVEVVDQKVFFLGDVVLHGRLARMDDGNFKGNIAAIDRALKSGARIYVPGHGPSGDKSIPLAYRGYLETVYNTVSSLYDQDISDYEMKPVVDSKMGPYRQWGLYNDELGRHISLCYLQVEQDAF